MKELIDKPAIVAEIERRLKALYKDRDFNYLQIKELEVLLSSLDILEVKVVDLEKELDFNAELSQFIDTFYKNAKIGHKLMIRRTARHFFELGLKKIKLE